MFLSKKILSFSSENAPECEGVYLFYNKNNEILYIGSSQDLKKRMNDYTTSYYSLQDKLYYFSSVSLMVKRLDEVEKVEYLKFPKERTIENHNAFRALEKKLIIKHKPKYCGEFLKFTSKENYYNEVKKVDKECEEYLKVYKKALFSFNKIMKSWYDGDFNV